MLILCAFEQGAALCALSLGRLCHRPCRNCWITNEKCSDITARGMPRSVAHMKGLVLPLTRIIDKRVKNMIGKARLGLTKISAKGVYCAFWDAPFGASPGGIYTGTPPELLHHYDLGLLKMTQVKYTLIHTYSNLFMLILAYPGDANESYRGVQ